MFERYNEKARRVIFHARREASEFGTPQIEAEFLLLGLLRENRHFVVRWLGGGDPEADLREEIAKRISKGPRIATSVDMPLSSDAREVLGLAAEEAERLAQHSIGPEHMFLGLLRNPLSRTARILLDRGVDIKVVRNALAREGPEGGTGSGSGRAAARRLQVVLVAEGDPPLYLLWESRPPAAGEIITVDGEDEARTYEVVSVEWQVSSITPEPPYLSMVLVHVREYRS